MEKIDIVGKNISKDDKKEKSSEMVELRKFGRTPIKGEYEKDEEDTKIIEGIIDYINEEVKLLGIKKNVDLHHDQTHLFSQEEFKKQFPEATSSAFATSPSMEVFINEKEKGRLKLYIELMHELIHTASKSRLYFNKKENKTGVRRTGYLSLNFEDEHEHFRGFNEAIVEKISLEIIKKHGQEIIERLKITEEEINEATVLGIYSLYIDLLDQIVIEVAEKKHEKKENVWLRFKKGLFTGEMMHLRDIERVFGKGSLRLLASLGSEGNEKLSDEAVVEKMKKYFSSNNESEKEKIIEQVLTEEKKHDLGKK